MPDINTPWSAEADAVSEALQVDPTQGLSTDEALARHRRYGSNQLSATKRRNAISILLAQFRSIVIWLLLAAAAVSFAFGELPEAAAIVAVIAINAAIGFFTELRAVRSIEALRQLGRVETTVRRDGGVAKVPSETLVAGDVVLIEVGDIISADMRIVEAAKLEANESTLTGESASVPKLVGPLPADTHLTERSNMLFKGTAITRGSGVAIITAIGLQTELGKISSLVSEAEAQDTPLEVRLNALARRLVWITAVIAAVIAVSGIIGGREITLAINVAIALAVATIPEGLPIVATIALARGMWRMARRHALVVRLSAVETLGATSTILTDKTGTLTENQMTVTRLAIAETTLSLGGRGLDLVGELTSDDRSCTADEIALAKELLTIGVLCNNASINIDEDENTASAVGDPTEVALLIAARKLGISRIQLLESLPEVLEEPFDPATRAMATFHETESNFLVAVKGAPEAILDACVAVRTSEGDQEFDEFLRDRWIERSQQLGTDGLRTMAIATKHSKSIRESPYCDLILVGLVGFHDPPRQGVREALAKCRDSGISVVMVTGDHPATAFSIAHELEMLSPGADVASVIDGRLLDDIDSLGPDQKKTLAAAPVVARASPEQKLDLIALHQQQGHVVAMTGDGVNDAPALKKADIGIAMGLRGTQVARESAAMILQDDRFETIVEAIAEGRTIFLNIRKFVVYLMSCNISEILIVGLATLANAPLPLLPLQILFLNLVTDVFPALALGVGEGPTALMSQPPRRADEPILTHYHWRRVFIYGLIIGLSVLGAMGISSFGLGFDSQRATTVSFLTLALAQLWHVFNMRDRSGHWLRNEIVRNLWVWGAIVLCLVLILCAVYVPWLSAILSIRDPGLAGWTVIVIMSAVPLLFAGLVNSVTVARPLGKPQAGKAGFR